MYNRYEARKATASDWADKILADYGTLEAADDRIEAIVDGPKWLVHMIRKEMQRREQPKKKREYRQAA